MRISMSGLPTAVRGWVIGSIIGVVLGGTIGAVSRPLFFGGVSGAATDAGHASIELDRPAVALGDELTGAMELQLDGATRVKEIILQLLPTDGYRPRRIVASTRLERPAHTGRVPIRWTPAATEGNVLAAGRYELYARVLLERAPGDERVPFLEARSGVLLETKSR